MLRFVLYFCASLISLAAAKAEDAPTQQVPTAAQPNPAATPAPAPAPAPAPPAPIVTAPEAPKAEPAKLNPNRYTVGAYLTGTGSASFNNATLNVGAESYVGTVDFNTQSGYGIMLEFDRTPINSWGLQAGYSYEFPRGLTNSTASFSGYTVSSNSDTSKVQISSIYMNAVYRWDVFYIPFGLNYSIPSISGNTDPVTISGGMGAQVGVGFQTSEWSAVELVSHVTTLRITAYDGTTSLDYGSGYVSDFRIQAKFSFK